MKYENDIKGTWTVIKEVIGKKKVLSSFPTRLIVDNKEITDSSTIAEKFNKFFVDIGPKLASKIPSTINRHTEYIEPAASSLQQITISEEEFETAFFALKRNKSTGDDDISANVVRSVYNEIKTPLFYIFQQSFSEGIFPEKLKIAKVTPIFKMGEPTDLTKYRPISVLPCFSKILEKIMYNKLYSYLTINEILYNKQFGFRAGHATDHAILELVDEITNGFIEKKYTLGVSIDFLRHLIQ